MDIAIFSLSSRQPTARRHPRTAANPPYLCICGSTEHNFIYGDMLPTPFAEEFISSFFSASHQNDLRVHIYLRPGYRRSALSSNHQFASMQPLPRMNPPPKYLSTPSSQLTPPRSPSNISSEENNSIEDNRQDLEALSSELGSMTISYVFPS